MSQPSHFSYDVVLSLDSSPQVRRALPAIEQSLGQRRMLAATLNHRFYGLPEKNYIKGTIEAHGLDHLMFSMRPTSLRSIQEYLPGEIGRFKALSQIVFVLQVMARYNIPAALVDSDYLDVGSAAALRVGQIEPQILEFLESVAEALPAKLRASKQFPWLYSVTEFLPGMRGHELTILKSITANPSAAAREYNDRQIGHLEKDLFWVGFDPAYPQVPAEKPYPATRWTDLKQRSAPGTGLYESNLRYCTRCCLPETMEGITFDEFGICVPCRSSEEKMHIDWDERRNKLDRIVDAFRTPTYYDCMLPLSGGKDSMYQAHILRKVLDVEPLAVTHGQNWLSTTGRYNLENCLQQFDLDHLVFNMNRTVINQAARKSLGAIGDACWHCHIGAGTFPVQSALAWRVSLMCYGESIGESDGRGSYHGREEASLFYNLNISAKVSAQTMADDAQAARSMSAWMYPDQDVLHASQIRYLHLGDYFFWDEERQVEFVKRNYEWMESFVENAYKGFKSVECVMAGVHDYANFIKRGIGRATVQASTDVRRGLLTREEGFELAKEFDTQRPHALDFFLRLTGLTEKQFEQTLQDARAKSVFASKLRSE